MKKFTLVLSCVLGLAFLAGTGCNSKPKISTALVTESFATASDEDKAKVQKGVDAANAGDHATALAILDELQYDLVDITPEQQAALMDLVQQLKTKLGEDWEAAAEAARQKLEEAASAAGQTATNAVDAAAAAVTNAADAVTEGATQAMDAVKPPSE